MGVIYLAKDTRLQRTAALKFLPPHLIGSDAENARFIHEARAAAALDHPNICTVYATIAFNADGFEEARLALERVLEQDPDFPIAWAILATGCAMEGLYDDATDAYLKYLELFGVRQDNVYQLRESYASGGIDSFFRTQIEMLQLRAKTEYVSPILIASAYSYLSESDSAFHYMEVAYRDRMLALIKAWPPFHRFKSDPRYADLLRRMNLPQ
jgi:serine/threonine protein kinase